MHLPFLLQHFLKEAGERPPFLPMMIFARKMTMALRSKEGSELIAGQFDCLTGSAFDVPWSYSLRTKKWKGIEGAKLSCFWIELNM